MVRHFWERNDIKGAISAIRKLPDHSVGIFLDEFMFCIYCFPSLVVLTSNHCCSLCIFGFSKFNLIMMQVQADVVTVLLEKMDCLTLDLFSCLLPVLLGLLDSKTER